LFSVTYSADDDRRRVEQQAYVFFGDLLDDCEGTAHKVAHANRLIFIAGDVACTLEHVLIFCTGADLVPLGGFGKKIDLKFLNNDSDKALPTSSTCFLKLNIPTCHRNNEVFNAKMIFGIRNSSLFGIV